VGTPSPGLSILVPVYNERPTVEQAVERALETAFPVFPVELIVVDDGSTDGTRELLTDRAWPLRVTILRHAVNQGKERPSARLAHARGTFRGDPRRRPRIRPGAAGAKSGVAFVGGHDVLLGAEDRLQRPQMRAGQGRALGACCQCLSGVAGP
jgi:hypothetical protein